VTVINSPLGDALHQELAHALGPERFVREITVAARLQHPHILPVFDSGTAMQPGSAVESLWFTMPYVPGESLRNRLAREPQLPLRDAVRIALEVADALGYAHGQGLVHRDVKPENILLSGDHCVIADFGLGRALDAAGGERLTETGITFGTPLYMSPEQASADVPESVEEVVAKALARSPADRFDDTPQFAQVLQAAVGAQPAVPPEPAPAARQPVA
jgi:serine/threonine-protein kinase